MYLLWHGAGFARRSLNEEAPVDRRVHLLFDHSSFCVHLVFASGEPVNTADPIQDLG